MISKCENKHIWFRSIGCTVQIAGMVKVVVVAKVPVAEQPENQINQVDRSENNKQLSWVVVPIVSPLAILE